MKNNGINIKEKCEELMKNHPDIIDRYVNGICEQNEAEIVEVMVIMFKEIPTEVFATLYVFLEKVQEKFEEVCDENDELKRKGEEIIELVDEYEE